MSIDRLKLDINREWNIETLKTKLRTKNYKIYPKRVENILFGQRWKQARNNHLLWLVNDSKNDTKCWHLARKDEMNLTIITSPWMSGEESRKFLSGEILAVMEVNEMGGESHIMMDFVDVKKDVGKRRLETPEAAPTPRLDRKKISKPSQENSQYQDSQNLFVTDPSQNSQSLFVTDSSQSASSQEKTPKNSTPRKINPNTPGVFDDIDPIMTRLKNWLAEKLGSTRDWRPDEVLESIKQFGQKNKLKIEGPNRFGPDMNSLPGEDSQYKNATGIWSKEANLKKNNPLLALLSPE